MEWRDQGILLGTRRHGETSAIIEVLTETRGLHAGIVRGGAGRRMAPVLQPGAQIDLSWKARLEDHLGTFSVEPVRSRTSVLSDRLLLAGMASVLSLLRFSLPEREAHPALYHGSTRLLDLFQHPDLWPLGYLRWEMDLLDDLGFGLDLSACAVLGTNEPLSYVSPRTGRAVSALGAGDWADRLLPLPDALLGRGTGDTQEVLAGLRVTGHFLTHHLAAGMVQKPLPEARARFIDRLEAKGG
nr:DNA repair protein RecO [Poseidonocella pacifica]